MEIRLATPRDVTSLPEIERLAAYQFKTYAGHLGMSDEMLDRTTSIETFSRAQVEGRLWVATGEGLVPIGFALVVDVSGFAHLEELDVLPQHGRRGVGTALLGSVCAWARAAGRRAVTLRTFRDVPWNAPFYERRGFRIVESASLSPRHAELEGEERARGLRPELRVTMARDVAG